jgi:nicotinamidase-related amidase
MTMTKIEIDPKRTALVLIDLQKGIVGMPLAPLSGDQVIASARALCGYFRQRGAPVVLVNVAYPSAQKKPNVDFAMPMPETMPPGWDELVDGLGEQPHDIRITKHGWGAFLSTELDQKLKAKGIDTIVIGGIATNLGVEGTAREAVGLNYSVIFASDVMTTFSVQHQDFALGNIFPLIGRVRSSEEIMS